MRAEFIATVAAHRAHHADWQADSKREEPDFDYYESLELVLESAAECEAAGVFSLAEFAAVDYMRQVYDQQCARLEQGKVRVGNSFWVAWHSLAAAF